MRFVAYNYTRIAYFNSQVNSLSCKSENNDKNQESLGENLHEAPLDHKKSKKKRHMDSGENLKKVLEGEEIEL